MVIGQSERDVHQPDEDTPPSLVGVQQNVLAD